MTHFSRSKEEILISYQVLRIEKFSKGDLGKIGAETERTTKHHRNEDIDSERTPLNYYFKKSEGGLHAQWKQTMQDLNATFKETKKAVAFEGVIITSDKAFFEERGYVPGEPLPLELQKFFADSYAFLKRQIGYHGTDRNILSAAVHLDETTPHLQIYYIPVVDEGRKKVYAKGADGKVLRNAKGSPVQEKDKNGKSLYERVLLEQPKICSSEFWEQRGAQSSFGNLQDEFHEQVARYYGLERGEVGSSKKHTTKYQWQKQQQEKGTRRKSRRAHTKDCTDRGSGSNHLRGRRKAETNTIPRRSCKGKASPRGTGGAAARTRTRAFDARSCPTLGSRRSVPAGERKKARQKADSRAPCGERAA